MYLPFILFCFLHHLSSSFKSFIASLDSISLPKIVHDGLSHLGWHAAIEEEMADLDDTGTWALAHLLAGKKAIGCKWIFTVKVNLDGFVARLKACLVAKGYSQIYGVDYSDTFFPVAKIVYVQLFISIVATYNWSLHQLDIKNAFLHSDLHKEVYMEQPLEFVAQGKYGKVCYLRKSLYVLKQSPQPWFGRFNEVVQEFELQKSKCDHSVFYK